MSIKLFLTTAKTNKTSYNKIKKKQDNNINPKRHVEKTNANILKIDRVIAILVRLIKIQRIFEPETFLTSNQNLEVYFLQ